MMQCGRGLNPSRMTPHVPVLLQLSKLEKTALPALPPPFPQLGLISDPCCHYSENINTSK